MLKLGHPRKVFGVVSDLIKNEDKQPFCILLCPHIGQECAVYKSENSPRHCPVLRWFSACLCIFVTFVQWRNCLTAHFSGWDPHWNHTWFRIKCSPKVKPGKLCQWKKKKKTTEMTFLHVRGLLRRRLWSHQLNPHLQWLAVTPGFNSVSPHMYGYCLTKPIALFC